MIVIFTGLPGSGKSYKLGRTAVDILYRNHKFHQKGGTKRLLWTNLALGREIEHEFAGYFQYWTDLRQLTPLRDVDVLIDEVSTYFDARLWETLSLEMRRWLAQHRKFGIEIFGTSQDFAQVDLAFRRLVNHLYHITKLIGSRRPSATTPPVNYIWGICTERALNPREYKEDKKSFDQTQIIPRFFLIERKYCEIFDTTQNIKRGIYPKLKHEERFCDVEGCLFHKKPKVFHH